ncbi:MAG: RagB/SusD family nutrient uptake outer membrane protein [Bacteroidota bacterium]
MKKKYCIGLLFSVLFLVSACQKDFLERNPLDQITEEKFYNTAEDARRAVLAVYAPMQAVNWYGKSWMITEIPADNSTTGGNDPDFSPIDNFTINPDNGPNAEFWTEHFRLVTLANQVITKVPPIDMDEDQKKAIIAEASFLRAFAYFDLVRIYGDVPIIQQVPTLASDLQVVRDPVEEVYDFIVADLEKGIADLPPAYTGLDLGRATRGAAQALLAKVYLTMKKFDEAIELSREIIAEGRYRLMDDFAENWLKETTDNNAESIFQVQYAGCGPVGTGNACQAFFAPWGQNITRNSDGWGSQIPTGPSIDNPGTTVKDIYEEEDLRKYHTIMAPNDFYPMINAQDGGYTYPTEGASRSGISIKKYVIGGGPDVCFMTTPQNVHVIRYADVLLTLAEATCRRNGGITVTPDVVEAFNAVRTRAGLEEVGSVTTEMVFEERRKEFAFENQRWFDLLRMDNTIEIMRLHGKNMQEFHRLFPIPSEERAINPKLDQNLGY